MEGNVIRISIKIILLPMVELKYQYVEPVEHSE